MEPHWFLNAFKKMPSTKTTHKAEETGLGILDAALALFRQEGFDTATMRDIAQKAGSRPGRPTITIASKDAIVMDFYRRSCAEMQPKIEAALKNTSGLERAFARIDSSEARCTSRRTEACCAPC